MLAALGTTSRFLWTLSLPFVIRLGLERQAPATLALFLGTAFGVVLVLEAVARRSPHRAPARQASRTNASPGFGSHRNAFFRPVYFDVLLLVGVGLALLLKRGVVMLMLPTLVQLSLFFLFGRTLLGGEVPLVERFARLWVSDLSLAEIRYCRWVTILWCCFFLVNGGVAAGLAVWGSLQHWMLYTGVVGYLIAGAIGAVEYLVRKYRFRRYGNGFHDRVLMTVFPPVRDSEGLK